jgi:hypothetical protein
MSRGVLGNQETKQLRTWRRVELELHNELRELTPTTLGCQPHA